MPAPTRNGLIPGLSRGQETTLDAHPSFWLQRGGMCDLKSRRGAVHLEPSEPRQEWGFWDQRPRVEIAALPRTETEIGQTEVKKPHQWRAFLDRLRKMPKQRTGWWRMQPSETGLQVNKGAQNELPTRSSLQFLAKLGF